MQVCTSSQTTMPTSHHSVFYRPDTLPAALHPLGQIWHIRRLTCIIAAEWLCCVHIVILLCLVLFYFTCITLFRYIILPFYYRKLKKWCWQKISIESVIQINNTLLMVSRIILCLFDYHVNGIAGNTAVQGSLFGGSGCWIQL